MILVFNFFLGMCCGHTSDVPSYQGTSFQKNDQIEDVIFVDDQDLFSQFPTLTTQTIYSNISSSFNNNIQRFYEETFGNFVPPGDQDLSPLGNLTLTLLGDQSFAPEFPTPTSQTICPNVSPYQETFNNNIQRSYKETIENFVPFGDQGLVPEFSTPNTHLLSLIFCMVTLPLPVNFCSAYHSTSLPSCFCFCVH